MSDLKVIGAGLGRTGTASLQLALQQLGFGPCHHYTELFKNTDRNHHFTTMLEDEKLSEKKMEHSLKEVFKGYSATVDYPGGLFYRELLNLNPDAKVILSVRDNPHSWAESARNTIFSRPTTLLGKLSELIARIACPNKHFDSLHKMIARAHGAVNYNDLSTDLVHMYTDWNTRVQETVPRDKLLVYNVKEGWEPLCRFLGVPVPDTPFPRVNSTKEWKMKVEKMSRDATIRAVCRIGAGVVVAVVAILSAQVMF